MKLLGISMQDGDKAEMGSGYDEGKYHVSCGELSYCHSADLKVEE